MKNLRLLFGILLLFLFACVREEYVEPGNDGGNDRISHVIPIEQALDELDQILTPLRGQTRGADRYNIRNIEVVSKQTTGMTRSAGGADTVVYIVNFEGEAGYAILGADDRVGGVIALMDQGNLTADEFARYSSVKPSFDSDKNMQANLPLHYIGTFLDEKLPGPIPEGPDEKQTFYSSWFMLIKGDPLMKTKWGQGDPYNQLCPMIDGRNTVAGCAAISCAQILAYNKMTFGVGPDRLSVYDLDWPQIFNAMNGKQGGISLPWMIHAVGVAVKTDYGLISSSSNFSNVNTALELFGYRNIFKSRYNSDIIKTMLLERKSPVYIQGNIEYSDGRVVGHAWVIDGVYTYTRGVYEGYYYSPTPHYQRWENKELIHSNFGWGGTCNGYYLSDVFILKNGAEIPDPDTGSSSNTIDNIVDKLMLSYTL